MNMEESYDYTCASLSLRPDMYTRSSSLLKDGRGMTRYGGDMSQVLLNDVSCILHSSHHSVRFQQSLSESFGDHSSCTGPLHSSIVSKAGRGTSSQCRRQGSRRKSLPPSKPHCQPVCDFVTLQQHSSQRCDPIGVESDISSSTLRPNSLRCSSLYSNPITAPNNTPNTSRRLPCVGQEEPLQASAFHHRSTDTISSSLSTSCVALSGSFLLPDDQEDGSVRQEDSFMPAQVGHVTVDSDATTFMQRPLCHHGVAVGHKSRHMRRKIVNKLRRVARHLHMPRQSSADFKTLAIL